MRMAAVRRLDWDGLLDALMDFMGQRVDVVVARPSGNFPVPMAGGSGIIVDAAGQIVIEGQEDVPRSINLRIAAEPDGDITSWIAVPDWWFRSATVDDARRLLTIDCAEFRVSIALSETPT
jgi:hypothetical protein